MAVWPAGWLAGWLTDVLANNLTGGLIDRPAGRDKNSLADRLTCFRRTYRFLETNQLAAELMSRSGQGGATRSRPVGTAPAAAAATAAADSKTTTNRMRGSFRQGLGPSGAIKGVLHIRWLTQWKSQRASRGVF